MDNLHSRIYRSDIDLDAMIELIEQTRTPEQLTDYPRTADLHELLLVPDIRLRTCLWEDPYGDLNAYAIVDTWDNLWFDLWPELMNTPLADEIVQWGVSCLRSQAREDGNSNELTLETNCGSPNQARIDMLLRRGFVEKKQQTLELARSLQEPIPSNALPAGFYIRSVRDESEAEQMTELHRAAFGTDQMTADYRAFMMQTPSYDPELDLVVIAPSGMRAAFCMCQIDSASDGKSGFSDTLGTRPEYQRKGLAKTLLMEEMRRMKNRGVEVVRLSTDSENLGMLGLAKSVGFKVEKTELWFSKPVPPVGFEEDEIESEASG